jgi:membrane protein DedA with SNARE-associated domain
MAVIWIGLMAASLLGYGVGAMAARPLARRLLGEQELERAHRFAAGFGPILLILSRPVPVFAELASLAAGMSAMPLRLFLLLTGLANLAVAFVYAGIGAAAMSSNSGGLAMLGAVILPLCAWLTYRWWLGRLS